MNYQGKTHGLGSSEKTRYFFIAKCVDMGEGGRSNDQPGSPRSKPAPTRDTKVYCPMCTHTVDAMVELHPKNIHVKRGQKCPRCSDRLMQATSCTSNARHNLL